MTNWAKREAELTAWCEARGLVRLPDSAYGAHVHYTMAPVKGLKNRVRVSVTDESMRAARARMHP